MNIYDTVGANDSASVEMDERTNEMMSYLSYSNFDTSDTFASILKIDNIAAIDYDVEHGVFGVADIYFENGAGLIIQQINETDVEGENPTLYRVTTFVATDTKNIMLESKDISASEVAKLGELATWAASDENAAANERTSRMVEMVSGEFGHISNIDKLLFEADTKEFENGVLSLTFKNGLGADIEIIHPGPEVDRYSIKPFVVNEAGEKTYIEDLRCGFSFTPIMGDLNEARSEFNLNGYLSGISAVDESTSGCKYSLDFRALGDKMDFFRHHVEEGIWAASRSYEAPSYENTNFSDGRVLISRLMVEPDASGGIVGCAGGYTEVAHQVVNLGNISFSLEANNALEFFAEAERVFRDIERVSELDASDVRKMGYDAMRDLSSNPLGEMIAEAHDRADELTIDTGDMSFEL